MSFPTNLSNAVDGVTEIIAAHLNNLEAKVGIDNSGVVTSLDYLVKNAGSIDPGHKHTAGALSGGNNGEVLYKAAGVWGPGTPGGRGLSGQERGSERRRHQDLHSNTESWLSRWTITDYWRSLGLRFLYPRFIR